MKFFVDLLIKGGGVIFILSLLGTLIGVAIIRQGDLVILTAPFIVLGLFITIVGLILSWIISFFNKGK